MATVEPCQVCGKPLEVGQQGCIVTVRPHEPVLEYHPFTPYFDIGLGVEVTSLAQRWRLMKGGGNCDSEPADKMRLEYRDHISKGKLSARLDRIHERKREEARARRG